MEAVALRIGAVFELLKPELPVRRQIIASGGAVMNSPVWLQILADVLGEPIALSRAEQSSARGVALLALGDIKDLTQIPHFVDVPIQPDLEKHAQYRIALQQQKELYEILNHQS
jgi:gluconokinase